MARTVECRQTASAITFYARFTAYERRWKIKLGDTANGMTATRAEEAQQAIVSDVRRGRWLPERSEQQRPSEATQSFHELASQWLEDRRGDLSDNGYTVRTPKCRPREPRTFREPVDTVDGGTAMGQRCPVRGGCHRR